MKTKERKQIQREYAQKTIEHYFSLLEKRFYPELDPIYVKEIQRTSQAFNIRLSRDQKLKFCKNCKCFWNVDSKEVRLNTRMGCKEYICKNCSYVRRFKYK